MSEILFEQYFRKLMGCYTGKAVGGTLGMPYEGIYRGVQKASYHVTYYDPVPTAMVGNDDLDLQVVWVECLRRKGLPVNRKHLAEAWEHIGFAPDEYGVAHDNLKSGLQAPLCGYYNNKFQGGMGAAIRSELWASLAPGDPGLAVKLAREDACVDHFGDGVDGSVFLTAVESAAYISGDLESLIETGLSYVSGSGRFAQGIRDTVSWWKQGVSWQDVRRRIIEKYGVYNWTDVTVNVCLIVLAMLEGRGDFSDSLCLVVNMGYDADCTGASLGSILGIINPDAIEEKWTRPIGDELVLSPYIVGVHACRTKEELCRQIAALAEDVGSYYKSAFRIIQAPSMEDVRYNMAPPWAANPYSLKLEDGYNSRESLISVTPLAVSLIYPQSVALHYDDWSGFIARFQNPTGESIEAEVKLRVPDGFDITPKSFKLSLAPDEETSVCFQILQEINAPKKRFNALDFICTAGGMTFTITSGIVTAYPWIRKKTAYKSDSCPPLHLLEGAEHIMADEFFQKVPPGEYLYAIQVKAIASQQARLVCQGTRPMKLWLNGQLLINYDAEIFEPAVHRGPSELGTLKAGWNQVIIHVSNDMEEGELFFGVGEPISWKWLGEVEWQWADLT